MNNSNLLGTTPAFSVQFTIDLGSIEFQIVFVKTGSFFVLPFLRVVLNQTNHVDVIALFG